MNTSTPARIPSDSNSIGLFQSADDIASEIVDDVS